MRATFFFLLTVIQFYYQFLRINPEILQSDILNSLCVEYKALNLNIRILAAIWNSPNITSIFFTFHSLFLPLFTLSVLKLIKSNLLCLSWEKADINTLAWLEWYSAYLSSKWAELQRLISKMESSIESFKYTTNQKNGSQYFLQANFHMKLGIPCNFNVLNMNFWVNSWKLVLKLY